LVENICQAIARDLLRDAMIRVDEAGYNIVLHVHDEIVTEGENYLERLIQIVTNIPHWAKGLPIDATGYFDTNYRK